MKNNLTIAQPLPLATKRTALVIRLEQHIQKFGDAARARQNEVTSNLFRDITNMNEFIGTLDEIAATIEAKRSNGVPRLVVSSYFLHECFKKLTADKSEQVSFITGVEMDGSFVLNQILELEPDKRTVGGVSANGGFTHKLLITLERFGHRLLAHFHSHPGNGPESTRPSGIDERFQTRLESAGHMAVAAIFSRDGFVRFFRMDSNFEVEVFGKGAEQHAPHIIHLTELN